MAKERYRMFRKSATKSNKNGTWLSEHELPLPRKIVAAEPHHSSKEKTERWLNRNVPTAHKQRTCQLPAVVSTGRRSSQFEREHQKSLQIQEQRRNKTKLLQPMSRRLLEQPTARSYWCRHCQQLQVKTWQDQADNIRYGTISRCFSPVTLKFKFKPLADAVMVIELMSERRLREQWAHVYISYSVPLCW